MHCHRNRIEQIRDLVLRATETDIEDVDTRYEMADALDERLEDHEAEFGSPDRPLRETVEGLCKAFGISPDWSRWTGEGWSVDEDALFEPFVLTSRRPGASPARAASPSSPAPAPHPPPLRLENAFATAANSPPSAPPIPPPPWRPELARDLE